MEEKVVKILNEMSEYLSIAQMKKLQEVMLKVCAEPLGLITREWHRPEPTR